MKFRSFRIAMLAGALAAFMAVPAFAQEPAGEGDKGEPIPAPKGAPAGPAINTVRVCEWVPQTYKVKRTTYKTVYKKQQVTAYRYERVPVTKTRKVTYYKRKAVWKNVTRTVYDRVPCKQMRTVMKPHYTYKKVTVMKAKKVDKGHWVCEEVPAPFKTFCNRLGWRMGQGFGHGRKNDCCDPCANSCGDPCADPCADRCPPPAATRTVKRWKSCWVTVCCPTTVCKKVCEMRPEKCCVTTYKCVPRQVTCRVCCHECIPCTREETYCCHVCKKVPYTKTCCVAHCVPCEEWVTCCKMVCRCTQVPAHNGTCGSGHHGHDCCDSGHHGHDCCDSGYDNCCNNRRGFLTGLRGIFKKRGCGGCETSCGGCDTACGGYH